MKKHAVCVAVGATIYPENISEIDSLIDFCLAHQVDFIRVAPGLRIGLAKDLSLDFSLHLNMIDKLQSVLRRKFINNISSFELIPENLYEYLSCSCPGGRYTYYLTPAGEVKICPFVNNGFDLERFETQNISEENRFRAMRNSMEQLMNYLPQAIGGKCASCELKCTCRGGCLATKLHSGLSIYGEQPLCVKEIFSEVVSRNIWEEDFRKLVGHWVHKLIMFHNRGIPLCIRQLPFWTIKLS
ncbi:MAG: putative mycofactocin radical SAM maturase MftC [Dehalococcoidia bacterium]|nr:putative mycofactocin radical SAM maturase MftC [Chloroflexota bacterium]